MQESNILYGKYNEPGLVLAMDFEGPGQTFVDSVKPSRAFIIAGAPADTTIVSAPNKNGISSMRQIQAFGGQNGFVYTTQCPDCLFPGDFWFETWGYCNGQGNTNFTGATNVLLSSGSYATAAGAIFWCLSGLKPAFAIQAGSGTNVVLMGTITTTNSAWHHYAMGRQGSTLYFFVNGQPAGSVTYTGVVDFSSGLVIAGMSDSRISGATYMGFNGYLDRLRMYNRCLNTAAFIPSTKLYGQK